MKASEFVRRAVDIADNYKTAYVWGTFGIRATASNMSRMISQYSKNSKFKEKAQKIYGKGFYFDCVGLIKGILWGWCGDTSLTYGGAVYTSGGVPDLSADQMINKCKEISNDFKKVIPGEAVWMKGHIGIYIGDGNVVEATPAWDGGVQKRKLSDRKWVKHGKLPWVEYEEECEMSEAERKKFNALVEQVEKLTERVEELQNSLPKVYHYTKDVPEWGRATVQRMLDSGVFAGIAPDDLNLSEEMLRMMVMMERKE